MDAPIPSARKGETRTHLNGLDGKPYYPSRGCPGNVHAIMKDIVQSELRVPHQRSRAAFQFGLRAAIQLRMTVAES